MLAQGDDTIPIPGSKSIKDAEENVRAVEVVLSAEEIAKVQEAVDVVGKSSAGKASRPTPYGESIAFQESPPFEG